MEYITYPDLFENLKFWLRPVDLYNLVRTCKRYNKAVTMQDIEKSTINEIDRRLYAVLDNDFAGFKTAMGNSSGSIVGSFVTQCILGEVWPDEDIRIVISEEIMYHSFDRKKAIYQFADTANNINAIEYLGSKYTIYIKKELKKFGGYDIIYVTFVVGSTRITFVEQKRLLSENYNICEHVYMCNGSHEKISLFKINETLSKCTNFIATADEIRHLKYRMMGFSFYDEDGVIVPDHLLWEKLGNRIINVKAQPGCNRMKVLSMNKYHYKCDKGIITYTITDLQKGKNKGGTIYHSPRKIDCSYIYSCSALRKSPCLFDHVYPGIEHLHGFDGKSYLFIIDTFQQVKETN